MRILDIVHENAHCGIPLEGMTQCTCIFKWKIKKKC